MLNIFGFFQMNLQVINEPSIEILSKVNTTNFFPMIWLDEVAEIDQVPFYC